MPKKTISKCLCCKEDFTVDVRNVGRQKYCPKPQCQRQSKAVSQRRWLEKPENRRYFRDAENAARVRRWQAAHPGYWRNRRGKRRRVLQETSTRKALISLESAAATPPLLQEVLSAPGPLFIGLIATLGGTVLQDDIACTSRRLVQLGQDILTSATSDDRQTGAAP